VPSPVRARSMQLPGPKHDQSPLTNDWKCFRGPWTPRRHSMATLQQRLRMCTYMERHFSLILGPNVKKYMFEVLLFIAKCWDWRGMASALHATGDREECVCLIFVHRCSCSDARHRLNFSQQSILD
jgi:hypothetical protein